VQTVNLVSLFAQGGAGLRRRDGHGHHDPLGLVLPDGTHGRNHGRAGREAVVHQDDDAVRQVGRGPVAPIDALAPLELAHLLRVDRLHPLPRDVE
jgi:hypothetical protein